MIEKDRLIEIVGAEDTSTRRLFKFLQIAQAQPETLITWPGLADAVTSQGALAAFQDRSLKIFACSLNTLKSRAQSELVAGWGALDFARRGTLSSLSSQTNFVENDSTPGRGSKAELAKKLADLMRSYKQLQTDNWQLIKAVRRLLSNADSIMEQFPNDALIKQIKTERAEVLAMFSFLKHPVLRQDETKEE
ncbi:hypothetical protein [Paraburkholderia sp. HP33-1]|uniref:hypothetical protein n=1 Tax=Paraburkholderia sp. HP33-1 TaxID=2883243 RepID=UPI001F19ADD0|nr:hypothetical protein [Paraburkholderia sp. HP33-1]